MNYRMIAIQVGDLLKYDVAVNDIERAARSVFNFKRDGFPNDAITSVRAQYIHDWVLTLARQDMNHIKRNSLLRDFLELIASEERKDEIDKILRSAGVDVNLRSEDSEKFRSRDYHEEINKHCRKLFLEANYFHAVFEAAKTYNKLVKGKSQSSKDGSALMMDVLSSQGVLKLNKGVHQTDKDVQAGIKFLSAGLMQAIRNPTAHEPALDWPISQKDCLDMLSFISYLLRQLDNAVYYDH